MEYGACKLRFPYGVHFGRRLLESTQIGFSADTLFSALYQEALKAGNETANELYNAVKAGKLLISDAFPFVADDFLLPKPLLSIREKDSADSVKKKQFKNMNYIAESLLLDFLNGSLNPEAESKLEMHIGSSSVKTSVAIRGLEDPMPYRIGIFSFSDKAGLYIIFGFETDAQKELLEDLLDRLSFSGIGGKKSSGLGRFEIYNGKMSDNLRERISKESDRYMTLSVALPTDEEIDAVNDDASYILQRKSGFVDSISYAESYMRKKDLFVYSSGSVFGQKFNGDIYDVSYKGIHPVYRYAKPIFIGV